MTPKGFWQILRLPLFVTVVADVLAGYTVAMLPHLERFNWHTAALLAGTSTGLYLFGMVMNDLVDIRRDRLLHVPRPLVTGDLGIAAVVGLLLATAGLAAACAVHLRGQALLLAITTFVTICFYNLAAKHGPAYIAMIVMGLARFFNFGIGASVVVGIPLGLGWGLLAPSGPLWMRLGLAIFFATAAITGYSISERRQETVSSRPWLAVFVVTAVVGFILIALPTAWPAIQKGPTYFVPPVARVVAVLVLAMLWPGGLRPATGNLRKPAEYAPFIQRALYWLILMDAAFVLDGLLIR